MDIKPFIDHMRGQRNCSDKTIRAYQNDLNFFQEFLGKKNIRKLSGVTHQVINEFIEHMRSRPNPRFQTVGLKDTTVARRLSAVSSFLEFTRANGDTKLQNPIKNFPSKWNKNSEPKPADEIALNTLEFGVDNLRDRFLILLLLSAGLRVSELYQLNRDSIRIEQEYDPVNHQEILLGVGEVVGKGNKRRQFYVDRNTLDLYADYYVNIIERRTDKDPALFVSQRKQRMSVRAIQYTLDAWCKKLGLKHIRVHQLRHSFATRLANANIPSLVLKDLMGHNSFNTTQGYFKLTDKTIARGYHAAMEYLRPHEEEKQPF